jgi:hypothetical protein
MPSSSSSFSSTYFFLFGSRAEEPTKLQKEATYLLTYLPPLEQTDWLTDRPTNRLYE